ncbi:MAG: SAM-dependent chlorinase/fluorinase [Acidobacteria bacterium]|nr:SAM-dependent chlorinase/fluorinase [Acidobacteriota bacterium]
MITLLTDFGIADYFIPSVKGVILSIHPQAQIIDLTHNIPAQDIAAAAFTLSACYHLFPAGTIHTTIVDPGVGSARHPIVIDTGRYLFVGPDNGIFSLVYAREKNFRVFHASRSSFFRSSISPTFHGRDVFAPLSAWLSKGIRPECLGEEIQDYVVLPRTPPQPVADAIIGEIIHIDHFGNCITNLTLRELDWSQVTNATRIQINEHAVSSFGTHFAQAPNVTDFLAYLGSAGYWEIALWQASAAQQLNVRRGSKVYLYR